MENKGLGMAAHGITDKYHTEVMGKTGGGSESRAG